MLAMNYRGPYRVRTDKKPYPEILHPNDATAVYFIFFRKKERVKTRKAVEV